MSHKLNPSTLDGLSRRDKSDRVLALYQAGFTQVQIAEMLGISRSYTSSLMNDPSGEKDSIRKRQYGGVCVECGGQTFNGGGKPIPKRCHDCQCQLQHEERYWKPERIIAAIQEWARIYGEPPKAQHWLVEVKRRGTPNQGRWPAVGTIQAEFGSWSNALEAAGFERRINYERTDEWKLAQTKWTRERLIEAARRWHAKWGEKPTSYEWRRAVNGWPSAASVWKQFGTWRTFLQMAFPEDRVVFFSNGRTTEGNSLLAVVENMFAGS